MGDFEAVRLVMTGVDESKLVRPRRAGEDGLVVAMAVCGGMTAVAEDGLNGGGGGVAAFDRRIFALESNSMTTAAGCGCGGGAAAAAVDGGLVLFRAGPTGLGFGRTNSDLIL